MGLIEEPHRGGQVPLEGKNSYWLCTGWRTKNQPAVS